MRPKILVAESPGERDANQDDAMPLAPMLGVTASQSAYVFISKVAAVLLGFGANYILARMYGVQVVGAISIMQGLSGLAVMVTVFGFDLALVKFVSAFRSTGAPSKAWKLTRQIVNLTFCLSFVGTVVLWFLSDWLALVAFGDAHLASVIRVGALSLIPITVSRTLGGYLRGAREAAAFTFINLTLDRVLFVVILVALSLAGTETSLNVAIGWLGAKVIVASAMAIKGLALARTEGVELREDAVIEQPRDALPSIYRFGGAMALITIALFVINRGNILLVGFYSGTEQAGIYKIALVIAGLGGFISLSAGMIFPTIVSELHATGDRTQLRLIYTSVTKWIFVLTAPVILAVVLFPEPLLLFFGPEYQAGGVSLAFLAGAFLVETLIGPNLYLMKMSGFERMVLFDNVTMAVGSIGLSMILIPRFGIAGAGAAVFCTVSALALIRYSQARHFLSISPFGASYFPAIGVVSIAMGVGILVHSMVTSLPLVAVFVGAVSLCTIVVSIRFAEDLDIIVLRRLSRRVPAITLLIRHILPSNTP